MPTACEEDEIFGQAKHLYQTGQYEAAFKLFMRLATEFEKGGSQRFVGWMYFCGEGVNRDMGHALHWFEIAAKQGDLEGMFGAGRACLARNDYQAALRWFSQACEQGFAPACYRLGQMHELGQGGDIQLDAALHCYHKAYSGGNVPAGLAIAKFLLKGNKGVMHRIKGAAMYAWMILVAISVAVRDSNSPRFLR